MFFQDFNFFEFKSEMSSTHCFLRTENLSICHGVVRFLISLHFNTFLLRVLDNMCARSLFTKMIPYTDDTLI